jgi:hypothetical protein
MGCLLSNRIKFFLILAGALIAAQSHVYADEAGSLQIRMGPKVMYCAARINVADERLASAMQDGIAVSTEWHVHVGKVRDYWLNENIADITVLRHAKPDLLTRSWLLTDTSSGISRRVHRIEDAIYFLSGLKNFPVLDRSLLLPDVQYRVSVSVEIHSEGIDNAWWANLWHATAASMQQDFSLP